MSTMQQMALSPGSYLTLGDERVPPIKNGLKVANIFGNGALLKLAHDGGDVNNVFQWCAEQVRRFPDDASYLLDLALLHLIGQRAREAYRVQSRALEMQQLYRVVGTRGEEIATRRRVLALVAPGDFMNNAQLESILNGSDIGLDLLYVIPGQPLPHALPEHDVVFCAVNESDENIPVLKRLSRLLPAWPRPVLNWPDTIPSLSRDGIACLFDSDPDICVPTVRRLGRSEVQRLASGAVALEVLLPGASFPILIRPVGSHGGKNLERIAGPADVTKYLTSQVIDVDAFFLASFIDYRGADGFFRKYRIVLIDGIPFLCHMALSEEWKIHYVNAGMAESAAKRADEARAMATFDEGFARRHGAAFAKLSEQFRLEFLVIDCGESPDGRLALFEAETAMIVHNLDSPDLYPYKQPQMARVFAAFGAMIERASLGLPTPDRS
jgi:hypothetical protein